MILRHERFVFILYFTSGLDSASVVLHLLLANLDIVSRKVMARDSISSTRELKLEMFKERRDGAGPSRSHPQV